MRGICIVFRNLHLLLHDYHAIPHISHENHLTHGLDGYKSKFKHLECLLRWRLVTSGRHSPSEGELTLSEHAWATWEGEGYTLPTPEASGVHGDENKESIGQESASDCVYWYFSVSCYYFEYSCVLVKYLDRV